LAIAACKSSNSWVGISAEAIATGMAKLAGPGVQWTTCKSQRLLIDGAHNPGAAQALRQFVDTLNLRP